MNLPFEFEKYLKEGVVKRKSPDFPRSEFLKEESEKSFIGLKTRIEKMGVDEFNTNSIIKDIQDIILEKIRAKMLSVGFSATGNFAHEAEVAYMRKLSFSDYEIAFVNELRQARNGITYYGKLYEVDYANKCYKFLTEIWKKLK